MSSSKIIIDLSGKEAASEALGLIAERYPGDQHEVRRAIELEVIGLLQEAGIEGADELEAKLKETLPGTSEPQNPDLYAVGNAYDDERQPVSSESEISHERLSSIARASAGITDLVIAASAGDSVHTSSVLEMGNKALGEIEGEESVEAREVLSGVVDTVVSVAPGQEG